MFISACSIRSAQCAALIALATAAGISRFETVTQAEPDSASTTQSVTRAAPKRAVFTYPARLFACFRLFFAGSISLPSLSASMPTSSTPTTSIPSDPTAPDTGHPAFWLEPAPVAAPVSAPVVCATSFPPSPDFAAVSVRQHRFPFAVGPPTYGATITPRAARTRVLGDSPACRLSVSRVASSSVLFARFPSAPFERTSRPRPVVAGLPSEPSLTLRGEPSLSPEFQPGFSQPIPTSVLTATPTSVLTPTSPFAVAAIALSPPTPPLSRVSTPTPSRVPPSTRSRVPACALIRAHPHGIRLLRINPASLFA